MNCNPDSAPIALNGNGVNISQNTLEATPASMNKLTPLPRPQPFWIISSSNITMYVANTNCSITINFTYQGTMSLTAGFQCHDIVRSVASRRPTSNANTFCASVNFFLSSMFDRSSLRSFAPTSICIIRPAVTIGPMPSSISVPMLLANIICIMYRRASILVAACPGWTPYNGVWAITRYTTSTIPVHIKRLPRGCVCLGLTTVGRRPPIFANRSSIPNSYTH